MCVCVCVCIYFNSKCCLKSLSKSSQMKTMTVEYLKLRFKGLSQIVPGARTESRNYYLSHIILLTVRDPGVICESPFSNI